jgi:hypothetical protein
VKAAPWRGGVAAIAAAWACAAGAAGYAVQARPEDGSRLSFLRDGHEIEAPRTEPGQAGFAQARVSADGRTAGWVAQMPNCCTSYPLPLVLVLYRDGKVIRRFDEAPPIWNWAFLPGRDEVVIQQAYPHGPEYLTFTRLRIADGKALARYACNQDERVHAPRPAWTRVIDEPCPAYMPPADAEEPAASAP